VLITGESDFRVGVIADAHIGSQFAPWPENGELSTGGRHIPNMAQKYLNENWYRIAKELPPLDVFVFNGDIIDGQQPKQQARYLVEQDPQFQSRAAVNMLDPYLSKCSTRYVTEGTEYHDGIGSTWAEWLAEEVGAVSMDEHRVWGWLLMELDGTRFDIAHKQSFMLRYRSTTLEREMQFSLAMPDEPDVIVRSHVHNFISLEMPNQHGGFQLAVSTPPWQIQSHYCKTSDSPNRKVELMLGMIVIERHDRELRVNKKYMFDHPEFRRSVYVKV
jgi:hypothetical protein